MSIADSFTLRQLTPERENRWQTRTSGDYIDYRSDSITRNQNIIRLPVTSTIVKETSTYVPLPPQTTTVTHTTLPITTTVSSVPMQIGIGQSINITSSKNNIPASYVVGPATISSNGPRELQGSFGSLPSPTLNLSSVRQEEVTNSMFRQGSASNLNPHLNSYPMESISKSQYDRCINECRSWQSKYNDLNSRFITLSTQISNSNSNDSQLVRVRQQNKRLQQRIWTLEDNERRINQNIEVFMTEMINKYRQLTLKQSGLLFDRFRLQCRAMDKP